MINSIPKPTNLKSDKLRKFAGFQTCTLQTPFCNNKKETVVLCHAPSETKGIGNKSDDFWGAHGCSGCHDFLDRRLSVKPTKEEELFYWMRGINRTLKRVFNEVVKV